MTNYDFDEIRRLWKQEPDEWVLKAATVNSSSYPPEVLDIIIEEAVNRELIEFKADASMDTEIIQKDKAYFFKDNTFRTRCVQVLLVLSLILWVIALFFGFLEHSFLKDIEQGVLVSEEEIAIAAEVNDIRQGIVGFGQVGLGTITFIFFMMWIHRSNNNARALTGEPMEFTPGWAVGWFFVPIAFLWKPYQVVKEIWQVSSRGLNDDSAEHSIVGIWWALWLFSEALSQAAFKLQMKAEEIDELILSNFAYILGDAVDIALKIFMLILICKVFSMQKYYLSRENRILETMMDQQITLIGSES